MAHLLVIISLFISFFGVYYYILTGNKYDEEVRFIPFVFLCTVMDAVLSMTIPAYAAPNPTKVILTFPLVLWVLAFLFLFLYKLMKEKKLSGISILIFLFPVLILTAAFLMYLLYPGLSEAQENNLLIYSYSGGMLLITFYLSVLFYKRLKIKKIYYSQQNLINILSIQLEIVWIFLIVWFLINFRTEKLFSDPLYIFFKLMEIAVSLTLYFYLFELYKNKLRQEKLTRLKGFVSVPEMLVTADMPPQSKGEKDDEPIVIHGNRYEKSLLNAKKLDAYKNRVEDFFKHNKKVYLDPDFNMQFLSSYTGISRYHLSQVFNIALHTSFPAYVNKKRIVHACELMKESNDSLTVSELMEKCGFRSRASFYNHFKKVIGCMPGEYLFS